MSPYGMHLLNKCRAHGFSPAQVSGVVMVKHHAVIKENHRVAGVNAGKWLPDDDIARSRFLWRHLIKTIARHVLQIQVLTAQPPPVSAFKVRQVNTAQVIRIPEKGVAVHDAMFELSPQKMRDWPESEYPVTASQQPRKPGHNLHLSISSRQHRKTSRMRVKDRCHLPFFLGCQPVIITDVKMLSRFRMRIPAVKQPITIND